MDIHAKHNILLLRTILLPIVIYALLAFLAALLGIFYIPLIWGLLIIIFILLWYKKIYRVPKLSVNTYIVILVLFILSTLIVFVTEPTIYTGRDQGSLSTSALQLIIHHTPLFHTLESDAFFALYGRGEALNFPGFVYTADGALMTKFPLPYISFIAGFVGLFGMIGFGIANAITLFIFLFASYSVTNALLKKTSYSLWFLALLITSFPILWFVKFTLSENLMGMALWGSIALLLLLRNEFSRTTILTLFLSITLLFFTRIEGLWLAPVLAFLAWKISHVQKWFKDAPQARLWIPIVLSFSVTILVVLISTPFYKTILMLFVDRSVSSNSQSTFSTFLLPLYTTYHMIMPLIMTGMLALWAIISKNYRFLLPLAIIAPIFFYYLAPQITPDHPWMLRRFVFALIPVTFFGTVAFCERMSHLSKAFRLVSIIILVGLLMIQLPLFTQHFFFAEHASYSKQVETFAQHFTPDDLILMDGNLTGDGWNMITGSLRTQYGRHAVYFFNPDDYSRLGTTGFVHVYLALPVTEASHTQFSDLIKKQAPIFTGQFTSHHLTRESRTVTAPPTQMSSQQDFNVYQLK